MASTITPLPPCPASPPTAPDSKPPTAVKGMVSFATMKLHGGNDSGYVSQTQSPDGKAQEEGRSAYRGSPIPFPLNLIKKKSSLFNIDIDERTRSRFKAIQPNLENLLLSHVRASLAAGTDYRPISMRLVMMGTSKDDAKPCIIVFCRPAVKKLIKGFMRGKIVSDICCPEEIGIPHFQISVLGNAPRLRRARVEVIADGLVIDDSMTLCGMPIQFRLLDDRIVNATLGGLIKVVTAAGEIRLLGLTAGHALWGGEMEASQCSAQASNGKILLQHDQDNEKAKKPDGGQREKSGDTSHSSPSGNDIQTPCDDTAPLEPSALNQSMRSSEGPNKSTVRDQDDQDSDDEIDWPVEGILPSTGEPSRWWFDDSKILGYYPDGDEYAFSQRDRCYDWALVDISIFEVNQISYDRRAQLTVSDKQPGTTGHKAVILCGGSKIVRHGELLPGPGRVLLGNGTDFVDAHMVTVASGEPQICDGDSGLWVVDSSTFEIYGHLVASDMLGGGYVIPLSDIFEDIKRCLGAQVVELPSVVDILHARILGFQVVELPSAVENIHQEETAEDSWDSAATAALSPQALAPPSPHARYPSSYAASYPESPPASFPLFDSGYSSCNITPTGRIVAFTPNHDSGYSSTFNSPPKRSKPPTAKRSLFEADFGSDEATPKKRRQDD